ncbi:MAG TPA: SRPBCC family protein [Gaiellaceae bacterium]
MARYVTKIESALPQAEAFAYMADFANARVWDPSVSEARRVGDAPIGIGSAFDVVARFGGRDVPLRYAIVEYDSPRRVVLEAQRPGFVSKDTITVEPAGNGSAVHYDATLAFTGIGRLFDPVMQRIFNRVGARATIGMQAALNS